MRLGLGNASLTQNPGRIALPAPVLLDAFSASAGFTPSASTTIANYGSAGPREGNVRLTGTTVNVTLFARKTTAASIDPSKMGVVAWMTKKLSGPITGLQGILTRGANTGTVSFSDSVTKFPVGRRWVAAHVSEFGTFSAGAPGTVQFQTSVNQGVNYDVDAVVGPMFYNAAGRPTVILTFDDCYDTIINTVFPLMQARGLVGTAFVPNTFVGLGGKLTLANLQTLKAAGWAICCDSTQDDTVTSGVGATALAELNAVSNYLVSNGLADNGSERHFCWTNGAWNSPAIASFRAAGYLSGRLTEPQTFYDRFGLADMDLNYPAYGSSSGAGTTAAQRTAVIDEAILRGNTAAFYFHQINASPTSINWDTTNFTTFLDYVSTKKAAGLIDVLTVPQWYARASTGAIPL